MGELTMTGLDEAVLAKLSTRAAAHGRSAEEEVAAIVKDAISAGSQMSREEWLALAARTRRASGRLIMQTIDLIHDGREVRMASLCP